MLLLLLEPRNLRHDCLDLLRRVLCMKVSRGCLARVFKFVGGGDESGAELDDVG